AGKPLMPAPGLTGRRPPLSRSSGGGVVDTLLSGQLLAAALVTGALYALTALGLNLVYGTMRLLNVAHGDLVMIGAYVAFWAFTLLSLSPLLGLFAAAVLAALFGLALYHGLFRRL